MRRIALLAALGVLALGLGIAPRHLASRTATSPSFVHFESAHVHPAVLTPAKNRLLVVNTPDGYLRVFDVASEDHPVKVDDVPVGLEPVSVACLSDSEAWVVNNLSDDVSIVNLNTLHVRATLRVGDEPADVVFANGNAYVSVSQEDVVKVYDPATLALLQTIPINGRMPRALARLTDGSKVYVASFLGGNMTTVLSPAEVPPDSLPVDPDMPMDPGLPPPPNVGLIVNRIGANLFDMYGNLWTSKVPYDLYDVDVAEILTSDNSIARTFGGMSSTNMGLAVSPTNGRIALSGTESRNIFRFEPRVTGYLVETVISFVSQSTGIVSQRRLDPHINYDVVPGTQAEADSAIGIPTGLAYSGDGLKAYVTSFATNKLAVVNPGGGTFSSVVARVPTVAGPTGIVVDDARHRLYVVGRFHNQLETIQADSLKALHVAKIGFDPTPDAIVNGRKFLYNGSTSGHGDQACATCHLFGDSDFESWDLGNPFGAYVPAPNPNPHGLEGFHPMKGPMFTQSLKGLGGTEPLHWRGDRVNLTAFNGAFASLQGRADVLADSEMAALGEFVMPLTYPPNPNENLDRTLPDAPPGSPSALRGQDFFFNFPLDSTGRTCNSCHTATAFGPGTNHEMVAGDSIGEDQDLKVPQLRNLYKKIGFSDQPSVTNKRGFGLLHDGSMDNLANLLRSGHTLPFSFGATPESADANRADLEAYLLSFDTGIAPAVGYQLTFDGANNSDPTALARLDTLRGQAAAGNCDLIAKGRVNGQARGWVYQGSDLWKADKAAESDLATASLVALAGLGSEVTVSGVPPGSGSRMGIDRDCDSYLDGDERDANSNPGDPNSTPLNVGVEPGPARGDFALRAIKPNPFRGALEVAFTLGRRGPVDLAIYDVMGREVRAVARGAWLEAGPQSLTWDGRDRGGRAAGAGLYFVRLRTERATWMRPVVRVR
ncbi:MAG TPA: beta-propeller fold lactonase family protein [Candidatus Eisenbacteria bacterium]|jgi:YVTN family beta-propeller protein